MVLIAVNYIRGDEFTIVATVAGVPFPTYPTWQSKEGGAVQAESTVTHPGGMLNAVALGGPAKRSDCIVKRMYTVDFHPWISALEAACGSARMAVSWTPLDANKNQVGKPYTLTGILQAVDVPNTDANAAAAAILSLSMSCDQ